MTHDPFYLPPDATAFDAAIAMTERHIAHVCVVENGLLRGVISERDLFSLQRVDLVHLAQTIRHADRVDALVVIRDRIKQLVDNMLAHGASSTQRSEEHTSELQSLMRISYAVFCLKIKNSVSGSPYQLYHSCASSTSTTLHFQI